MARKKTDADPAAPPSLAKQSKKAPRKITPREQQSTADRRKRQVVRGPVARPRDEEIVRLTQELAASGAKFVTVTREYEAGNERLQVLNEELLSSNEEMQTLNEEMETAREELQATNEDLTTLNDELQSRNAEMKRLNDDLANVLRSLAMPVVLLGSDLQIRRFNDAAARMLNILPADVGRPLSDLRPNVFISDLGQLVGEAISTLATKEEEVRDREGRWYSLRIRPYKTVDNRIDGVLVTLVDINDIKLSLLQVRKAYDYANDIVETVREPLLILDSGLRVVSANRSFYECFLVDPEETEGRPINELGRGQGSIPELMALLEKVLTENRSFSDLEVALEFPDIGLKTMMINAREIRSAGYAALSAASPAADDSGMILLSIEDITGRKKIDEALLASMARYRSYVDVTEALGWTTTADGDVVEDIPSWRIYTGQTYEEVAGQGWSKAVHPEDREHALRIWEEAVRGIRHYEVEYRIRRHDGIYRHFMVRGMPVLNGNGSVREWVGTCIDITERKEAEESLMRLNRQLQAATAELTTAYKDLESFSYSASHDLREPLVMIDWYAGFMMKKYGKDLGDEGREMLSTITTTSKKMAHLIEVLLSFSRVSTKEVVKTAIDMQALSREVAEELRRSIGSAGMECRIGDLPPAWGDRAMIRQALVNLLSNAIKYGRPEEKLLIEVSGFLQDGEVVYSVRDNGIGFDMELSERLFGYFQRIHTSREVDGIGIGLVIVKNIIVKHGGRVWAEGRPGEGATFYFALPSTPA